MTCVVAYFLQPVRANAGEQIYDRRTSDETRDLEYVSRRGIRSWPVGPGADPFAERVRASAATEKRRINRDHHRLSAPR